MTLGAAILAGGRGKRLGGVAKGLVPVGGEPIVARQLRALAPYVAAPLVVVAGDAGPYAALGARLVTDLHPGAGPLAGLEAALQASDADALLVFACDLPFLDSALIEALRDARADAAAVVARLDGRAQPLAARYARAILPRVTRRLSRDKLRLLDLVAELDPCSIDFPAGTRALFNVNTPANLARAEALAAAG